MTSFRSALITGGTGFIGSALVRHLLAEHIEVTCLIRSKHRSKPLLAQPGLRILEVSSFEVSTLRAELAGISADVVFNLAAYGVQQEDRDFDQLISGNVALLTHLLEVTSDWPIQKFIHAGSCSEYGFPLAVETPIQEDHRLHPTSVYGAAKATAGLFGSCLAAKLGVPFLTLRLFGVYGRHESPQRLVPYLMDRLEREQAVDLTPGEQVRDLLFEDDVTEAFIQAARSSAIALHEAYNVCSAQRTRIRELGELVAAALNRPSHLLRWGARSYRKDEPMWLVGDNRRFLSATEWLPRTTLESGLSRIVRSRAEVKGEQQPNELRQVCR